MKRALTFALVLATSLTASAGQETSTSGQAAKAEKTAAAEAVAQPDSPLVAAAKRANRLGKKPSNVITNSDLKTTGANAHVTTTTSQKAIKMPDPMAPPRPTPEMAVVRAREIQQKQLDEIAAKKKKEDEARMQARAAAAAASEEGLYDEADLDPAQAERTEQEANQQKPPQF